jgi:hypothetical protein
MDAVAFGVLSLPSAGFFCAVENAAAGTRAFEEEEEEKEVPLVRGFFARGPQYSDPLLWPSLQPVPSLSPFLPRAFLEIDALLAWPFLKLLSLSLLPSSLKVRSSPESLLLLLLLLLASLRLLKLLLGSLLLFFLLSTVFLFKLLPLGPSLLERVLSLSLLKLPSSAFTIVRARLLFADCFC